MSEPTDYAVVEAMRIYGGSFVRMLGELWLLADSDNRALIKATWPVYWMGYAEHAKRRAAAGEGPK